MGLFIKFISGQSAAKKMVTPEVTESQEIEQQASVEDNGKSLEEKTLDASKAKVT